MFRLASLVHIITVSVTPITRYGRRRLLAMWYSFLMNSLTQTVVLVTDSVAVTVDWAYMERKPQLFAANERVKLCLYA